jgi:hypothetical protein
MHPAAGQSTGQVGWELQRSPAACWANSSPWTDSTNPAADFSHPAALSDLCEQIRPRSSSTPQPTPPSTRRERTRLGPLLNATSVGVLAEEARSWAPGCCTTAPTTSLTAAARCAPGRRRPHRPPERLRRHQARRRAAHPSQRLPPPHPAHQLGLRRARWQLRQDHAAAGAERERLTVIDDQMGRAHRGRPAGRCQCPRLCAVCGRPQDWPAPTTAWLPARPAGMATPAASSTSPGPSAMKASPWPRAHQRLSDTGPAPTQLAPEQRQAEPPSAWCCPTGRPAWSACSVRSSASDDPPHHASTHPRTQEEA